MLKLVNITKEYKVEEEITLALKNVSIEFRQNEFVSILGPSGCGKTTLLNIVGGLDRYTYGDIQVDGISTKEYDDVDWDTYRNKRVGFVFQSYNLIPHMSILKNVALCLTLSGVDREERRERAMEALRKVGLESQARKKPMQLSGGQMQRVAIARALVNNPDIILADEPTGALDTESGLQVMELLKEVAKDRLVVMVTHNPQLAEEYSTRIVYLKDGEVVGDTMPYNSDETPAVENAEETVAELVELENVAEESAENADAVENADLTNTQKIKKNVKKMGKFMMKMLKRRQYGKSAMKLGTAINLSWNNLISKKGRTFLTSVAGSIGIIGIILVLSLSNGATAYVKALEEDALSTYPLTVTKSSLDISSLMQELMGIGGNTSKNEPVNDNEIKGQIVLGGLAGMFLHPSAQEENDLYSLKKKIESDFDHDLATVKYNYGTSFNVYATDPKNDVEYMKTTPYAENMYTLFEYFNTLLGGGLSNMEINIMGVSMTLTDAMGYLSSMIGEPWAQISTNTQLVESQYEVVGGSWPTKANEVVVVVNSDNTLYDYQLFMVGLKSSNDLLQLIMDADAFVAEPYSIDEILSLEYKIMSNVDYLKSNGDGTWSMENRSTLNKEYVDSHAMTFADGTDTVKVVGVVRPKEGSIASSIGGVIGYTSALDEALLQHSENHEAVKEMKSRHDAAVASDSTTYESVMSVYKYVYPDQDDEVKTIQEKPLIGIGESVSIDTENVDGDKHATIMRELGFIDKDYPQSIDFYCSSFESKEKVAQFLSDNEINYSDSLAGIMGFVNTMVTTITGVLVGFAAISLVVSTIMIAIIIYTSVIERRKEIGVLRSIGARKRDISRVFLAESAILGGYSGFIGVLVSSVISVVASVIVGLELGIENLLSVSWWQCLFMFGVSIVLSMVAGFIPSRIAANKDPAIALRSE